MNKLYGTFLLGSLVTCGMVAPARAQTVEFHSPFFTPAVFDVGSAAGRILSTATKYFLSDDTDLEAKLVWKKGKGGCGGCYKKDKGKASPDLKFAAVLNDISIEEDVYRTDKTLGKTDISDSIGSKCVAALAQQRIDETIANQASLKDMNERSWAIQYQSQRRSIQALTDALNMKRLYNSIKDTATSIQDDYSDYTKSMSTIASKRLLLDQLLALKKRVVAARVRVRAQTLELNGADLKLVTSAPELTGICTDEPETTEPENQNEGETNNENA